ncbi:MAG: oligosaccharide flippase family protein [Candidatus Eisenbacteria bacterium]|uniref:Oligosaccharide flippase family protein n=1 Tax=Eiseniibacteriota bacterium TaxID=2212470 RepID=A0A9D6L6C7_UNCEI|nr:oligosaccharide flippase family protein [Candidatus Eisenbacteria bacterium]MBI3539606.1 oligosaccharide flippase family protein [Candidatus Eisenbacteria bacterium]
MHPRKFIRDSVGFASSQYLVRFLNLVRGLVAARMLGPAGYGAWNAIMLLFDYGGYAPLGTYQGLDQAVPARIVDGHARRLERVKRAGLFNVAVASLLFGGGCLLFFGTSHGQIRTMWGLSGVGLTVACVTLTHLSLYHLTLMRSHGNIGAVSLWFLLQSVVGVVLGLALIPAFGVWGLLWGWVTGTLLATISAMVRGHAVVPLAPVPSRESWALLAVGFPMFMFTVSSFVMRSIDRVIILRFLGTEALGLYGLGVTALTFLLTLPDAVSYVLYPQLVRRYREGGDDPAAIRDHVERAVRVLAIAVPAFCAIAYLGADGLVDLLLPRFRGGVAALRILCFGAAGLALANIASIVLMTLGRQLMLVPVAVVMSALGVALDLLAIRAGYDIRGVAWAMFITFVLNSAVLLLLADIGMDRGLRHRAVFLTRSFLPLAIAIPLAYAFERMLPGFGLPFPERILRFAISAVGWLAIYGLLTAPLARGIGLKRLLREFNWPWSPARREASIGG